MEAGHSAAGDGHEQGGEHITQGSAAGSQGIIETGESGHIHGGVAAQDAHNGQDDHTVQQEGAEVVTGLQQDPHGGNGSNADVQTNDDHPHGVAQVDGVPVQADVHAHGDTDHTDNGGDAQRSITTVYEEAEDDGHQDEHDGDDGGGSVGGRSLQIHSAGLGISGLEGVGNDGCESGHHQDQGQIGEDDKQLLGLGADGIADDFADGLALMPDGCEQGAEIVDAAEEDTTDEHPQHHGHPAEHSGLDGAVDGACAGDGREVMAHQHGGLSGTIILAVFQFMSRGNTAVIDAPLLGKPAAIENVTYDQHNDANDQKQCSIHKVFSFPNNCFFALQNSVLFKSCAALLPLALENAFPSPSTARPEWKSIHPQKAILKLL